MNNHHHPIVNHKTQAFNSLWMLNAGFFFAVMGACVKLGGADFTPAELVFYRSLFGFLAIFLFMPMRFSSLRTPYLATHISRSINGFVALMLFFYAIGRLPLATAVTLNYTSPIFMAMFTVFLLRERIRPALIVTIISGFIGVCLLLNPTTRQQNWFASIPGLVSGLLTGWVYIQVTQLGRSGEPAWRIVFYFTLVSLIGSGVWMLMTGFRTLELAHMPLLLALGASATIAQLSMTKAYGKGDPLTVGSLAYSTVIFASLFDIFIWHESLSTDQWAAIGLIIASGILSVKWTITNRIITESIS